MAVYHMFNSMTYLKLVLTAVFWGGTFVAGRAIAPHVGPFSGSFLRFALASLVLVPLLVVREKRLPRLSRAQLLPVIVLGLTGVAAYNIFFLMGLRYVTAGKASLIIALNPVFISLFSVILFKEHMNILKAAGIVLSVTGAMVVISGGSVSAVLAGGFGRGELLILGCVASWVTYSLVGKKVLHGITPLTAVAYASLAGTLVLLVPALGEGMLAQAPAYGASVWINLFFLAFFGTVLGFLWYYDGIRAVGPSRAGVFINFVPVSAVLMGIVLLGESMTLPLAAGGALVLCGVILTNRK